MAISGIDQAYSLIQTAQARMAISGNNVANVNTEGFQARSATQQPSGLPQPAGIQPPATGSTVGPAYINQVGQGTETTSPNGTYAPARPGPVSALESGGGSEEGGGARALSTTDPVTERTNQMNARNAYSAGSALMQTANQMNRTLMDLQG